MLLYNKLYKHILYILIISIFIGNSTRACESFIRYISDGDLLNENMPFYKNMTYLSAISNIFGAEYGYGFSLSSHSTDSIMMDRQLPAHHLAFDIGWMGIGGSSCRILDFGVKGRYEYGFDARSYGTHRFGIETYYHSPLFNIQGWQVASVVFGVGGRLDNIGINGGTYIDAGMLILPSSPVHASLVFRSDFITNAPTQHSVQLSLRFPFAVYPAAAITAVALPIYIPVYIPAALIAPFFNK